MNHASNARLDAVLKALPERSAAARWFRLSRRINLVLRHAVGICLFVMGAVVLLQVAVRFVFPPLGLDYAAPWSEELARYLMVWCIFIGAGVASRDGDLIAVESLVDAWKSYGWALKACSYVVTLVFLVYGVWLGWRWVQFGMGESSTVMDIPLGWVYLSLPVGFLLMVVNMLTRFREEAYARHLTDASSRDELPEDARLLDSPPPVNA